MKYIQSVGGWFPDADSLLQETLQQLTCSLLSICQVWRDGDSPLFPTADSQQGLLHTWNHIPQPDVGVVCTVPLVAADSNIHWLYEYSTCKKRNHAVTSDPVPIIFIVSVT